MSKRHKEALHKRRYANDPNSYSRRSTSVIITDKQIKMRCHFLFRLTGLKRFIIASYWQKSVGKKAPFHSVDGSLHWLSLLEGHLETGIKI